jgi:hypothetical protein
MAMSPKLSLLAVGVFLLEACFFTGSDLPVTPTTANPLGRGVECTERKLDAEADPRNCQILLDDCTDRLTYELTCRAGSCDCVVDGDRLGAFTSSDATPCDIDIGRMKELCGWVVHR